MRQLSVISGQLSVELWGKQGNPPLLLLHGFMGRGADWQPIAQSLAQTKFVIAPDLPGHGDSHFDDPEQFTMLNAARLVIQLLNELNIDRCDLLGYSMGGRTALYLAIHYPKRFGQIILESASPGLRTEQERAARRLWDAKIAARLASEPLKQFLTSWYEMTLFDSFRMHPNFEHAFERRVNNSPHQLAFSMQKMGTGSMPSLWEGWRQVQQATLIVGALDAKYVGVSAEMLKSNPTATRHILPNAGHNTHFERPTEFLSLLQSHLTHNSL